MLKNFLRVLLLYLVLQFFGTEYWKVHYKISIDRIPLSMDIVIVVHDGLPYAVRALRSLEQSRICPSRGTHQLFVYIVNANSGHATSRFLTSLHGRQSDCLKYFVLKSETASYTYSANLGLSVGSSEFVALLNSDVILTRGWLCKLHEVLVMQRDVVAVGPLSNSACYQSVPDLVPSDWSSNRLPCSVSPDDVSSFLGDRRTPSWPFVPLLNGFAVLYKRLIFRAIGLFNDTAFPVGYGEENEFFYRAHLSGYKFRIADNVYLYHEKSASFGAMQRRTLIRQAQAAYSTHLQEYITRSYWVLRHLPSLAAAREDVKQYLGYRNRLFDFTTEPAFSKPTA